MDSVIIVFHIARDGGEIGQSDHDQKTHKNSSRTVAKEFVKGGSVSTVTIKGRAKSTAKRIFAKNTSAIKIVSPSLGNGVKVTTGSEGHDRQKTYQ